jgi:hypothetical protein
MEMASARTLENPVRMMTSGAMLDPAKAIDIGRSARRDVGRGSRMRVGAEVPGVQLNERGMMPSPQHSAIDSEPQLALSKQVLAHCGRLISVRWFG